MRHDAEYAAREIGKTANWLKRHAHELPHSRAGRTYYWDDVDLAALREALRVRPDIAPRDGSSLTPITGTRRAS